MIELGGCWVCFDFPRKSVLCTFPFSLGGDCYLERDVDEGC